MSDVRTLTQAELIEEATARFGTDQRDWAFRCPNCGDVATIRDFCTAGADSNRVGQECIGRQLGALSGEPERGCDWAAYGLLHGPWTVVMPSGRELASFPLADAPASTVEATS